MPICWIIAGPNGAGKTTFALEYLPKVADRTRCFMNNGGEPVPVFEQQGDLLSIFDHNLYQHLVEEAIP